MAFSENSLAFIITTVETMNVLISKIWQISKMAEGVVSGIILNIYNGTN